MGGILFNFNKGDVEMRTRCIESVQRAVAAVLNVRLTYRFLAYVNGS